MIDACGLCGGGLAFLCEDKRRPYYICNGCGLISVPEKFWLCADDEKKRYDLHDNSLSNSGYVDFLSQIVDEITKISASDTKILDFGCGKEAVLCQLINNKGLECCAYDPLYGRVLPGFKDFNDNNDSAAGKFDIIVLCEVIEHVRDINAELELIGKLLREGGVVIVRTRVYGDLSAFPGWWYAQDPTHIRFFSKKSLGVAAARMGKVVVATGHSDILVLS